MRGHTMRLLPALLGVLAWATLAAAQTVPGPQQGVLLLRNGELIAGRITLSGDRYDVTLNDGELRIKTSEVEMFGRDAAECYRAKLAAIDETKVEDRLALAEWCLRQHLPVQAEAELQAAIAVDRTHPKIALVRRRLELGQQQPAAAAHPASHVATLPTTDDLDRMVRNMPPGCVETFTNSIQPLLLNHCSTAACHGPQSKTSLKLLRIPVGRVTSRRATQRNLYATLSSVNREDPNESPLLLAPTRPHGTTKTAIFTNHDAAQYKMLVDWVARVSNYEGPSKAATVPATVPAASAPLLQTVASPKDAAESANEPDADEPDATETPAAGEPAAAPFLQSPTKGKSAPTAGQAPKRSTAKRGELPTGFVPKDPFDPEIFNRRFFAK